MFYLHLVNKFFVAAMACKFELIEFVTDVEFRLFNVETHGFVDVGAGAR